MQEKHNIIIIFIFFLGNQPKKLETMLLLWYRQGGCYFMKPIKTGFLLQYMRVDQYFSQSPHETS